MTMNHQAIEKVLADNIAAAILSAPKGTSVLDLSQQIASAVLDSYDESTTRAECPCGWSADINLEGLHPEWARQGLGVKFIRHVAQRHVLVTEPVE